MLEKHRVGPRNLSLASESADGVKGTVGVILSSSTDKATGRKVRMQ